MPKAKAEVIDMFDGLAPAPGKIVEHAKDIWNEHAALYKWKLCKVLDKTRQAAIKRAVGDYGGIAGWRDSLASVAKNRFVQGMIAPREGYKQFVANIDWFCRPVTVRKVLEDFYEDEGADRKKGNAAGTIAPPTDAEKWGRWLKSYAPGRFWPSSQGPRPEDIRCTGPADLLAWWREQHKVSVVNPNAESPNEKRRAGIVSLRKAGMWELANRREEELAQAEGRPAVLVAAPEIAHLTGSGSQRRTTPKPKIFDGETGAPASRQDVQRAAVALQQDEPPPWSSDDVPEAEYETIGPE